MRKIVLERHLHDIDLDPKAFVRGDAIGPLLQKGYKERQQF